MMVLLVEDDKDLTEMYTLQLRYGGHSVQAAATAQQALDILNDKTIDVILLDLMLPNHNGIIILYELRSYEDWQKIPVIILSNTSARELGISGSALKTLGIRNYLDKAHTKPDQLLEAIEAALL